MNGHVRYEMNETTTRRRRRRRTRRRCTRTGIQLNGCTLWLGTLLLGIGVMMQTNMVHAAEERKHHHHHHHPSGFLTEEDGRTNGGETRRSLRTVGLSACLPGVFDVDCFLSGGECRPRARCTGFSSVFRIASAADAGARGRGLPRVFDEVDEESLRQAGGEELASTARFAGCPGFDCSCCLPCQALTPTVHAVQCALAGGECSTRLDCALRGGRFDPTGCGFFSARTCGCCIFNRAPPSPVEPPPPPGPVDPPPPSPDPVVPAPPPPNPENTCESGGRQGTLPSLCKTVGFDLLDCAHTYARMHTQTERERERERERDVHVHTREREHVCTSNAEYVYMGDEVLTHILTC